MNHWVRETEGAPFEPWPSDYDESMDIDWWRQQDDEKRQMEEAERLRWDVEHKDFGKLDESNLDEQQRQENEP